MAEGGSDIKLMIALIDQEANEKVEEIEVKMEEEFNVNKNKIVQQEIVLVNKCYKKKEEQLKTEEIIETSNMFNQVKLKILEAQNQQVELILADVRKQLTDLTDDEEKYPDILEKLLIEGVYRLLEPEVTVQIRKEDVERVEQMLPNVVEKCAEHIGIVNIQIDSKFLSSNILGGIKMWSRQGKIKLNNTLESRMMLVSSQLMPEIRNALFGPNLNRIYND